MFLMLEMIFSGMLLETNKQLVIVAVLKLFLKKDCFLVYVCGENLVFTEFTSKTRGNVPSNNCHLAMSL